MANERTSKRQERSRSKTRHQAKPDGDTDLIDVSQPVEDTAERQTRDSTANQNIGIVAHTENDDSQHEADRQPIEEAKGQQTSSESEEETEENNEAGDNGNTHDEYTEEEVLNADRLPHPIEAWTENMAVYHRGLLKNACCKVLKLAERQPGKLEGAAAVRYRGRGKNSRQSFWHAKADPAARTATATEMRLYDAKLGYDAADALVLLDGRECKEIDQETREQVAMMKAMRHFTNAHWIKYELACLSYSLLNPCGDDASSIKSKVSEASNLPKKRTWDYPGRTKVKHSTIGPPNSSPDSKASTITQRQVGKLMRSIAYRDSKRQKTDDASSTLQVISERPLVFVKFSRETRDANEETIGKENISVIRKHLQRTEAMARFNGRAIGLLYGSYVDKKPQHTNSSLVLTHADLPSEYFVYGSMFPKQKTNVINTNEPFNFNSLVAHEDFLACNRVMFSMEPIGLSVIVDSLGEAATEIARQLMMRSGAIKFVLLRVDGTSAKRIVNKDFYSFTQSQQITVNCGDPGFPANLNFVDDLAYIVGAQQDANFMMELVGETVMVTVAESQVLNLMKRNELICQQLLPLHEG